MAAPGSLSLLQAYRFSGFRRLPVLNGSIKLFKNEVTSSYFIFNSSKKFCTAPQKNNLELTEYKETLGKPNQVHSDVLNKELRTLRVDMKTINSVEDVANLAKSIPLSRKNAVILCSKLTNICYYRSSERDKIKNHELFTTLCAALEKNLQMYLPMDLAKIFHFATLFEIPQSSLFMVKIMTLILDSVNTFLESQLMNIVVDLEKSKLHNDPTISALKKAILACLENRNFVEELSLEKASLFFSSEILTEPVKLKLAKSILEAEEEWTSYVYSRVVKGLKNVSPNQLLAKKLLNRVKLELISDISDKWPTKIISGTCAGLSSLAKLYKYYDEGVFDALASVASRGNRDFNDVSNILRYTLTISHFNYSLYQHYCQRITELIKNSENISDRILSNAAKIFTKTNFLDVDEETKNFLINEFKTINWTNKGETNNKEFVFKLMSALEFVSVNVYNKNLMDTVYNMIVENYETETITGFGAYFALIFNQYMSIFHPEDQKSFSNEIIDKLSNLSAAFLNYFDSPLIEKVFGGCDYILSNCNTSEGFTFSHVALVQPDGTLINLSNYKNLHPPINIQSINVPDDCKLLLIQYLPKSIVAEFLNVPLPTFWTRVISKIENHLGCSIVLLSYEKIQNYNFTNQLIYIQKQIEAKCGVRLKINI